MINRIVLVGRVVADPEERQTNEGTVISKFRIAVDRVRKGRDGERQADFFNVTVFGRTAEFCNRYLGRGDLCGVDGRLEIDEYTDKNNQRQRWVSVVADNVQKYSWDDRDRGGGGGGGGGRRDDREREREQPARDGERRGGRWDHTPDDFGDEEAAAKPPAEGQEGRRQTFDKPADDLYEDDDDDPFAEE